MAQTNLQMKMTCLFREGEVHFNYNLFVGILTTEEVHFICKHLKFIFYFFAYFAVFTRILTGQTSSAVFGLRSKNSYQLFS